RSEDAERLKRFSVARERRGAAIESAPGAVDEARANAHMARAVFEARHRRVREIDAAVIDRPGEAPRARDANVLVHREPDGALDEVDPSIVRRGIVVEEELPNAREALRAREDAKRDLEPQRGLEGVEVHVVDLQEVAVPENVVVAAELVISSAERKGHGRDRLDRKIEADAEVGLEDVLVVDDSTVSDEEEHVLVTRSDLHPHAASLLLLASIGGRNAKALLLENALLVEDEIHG